MLHDDCRIEEVHNLVPRVLSLASRQWQEPGPGNGHVSSNNTVVCGLPQGFVLGPFLFLLYINDIFHYSKYLSFILFADDANIYFVIKTWPL